MFVEKFFISGWVEQRSKCKLVDCSLSKCRKMHFQLLHCWMLKIKFGKCWESLERWMNIEVSFFPHNWRIYSSYGKWRCILKYWGSTLDDFSSGSFSGITHTGFSNVTSLQLTSLNMSPLWFFFSLLIRNMDCKNFLDYILASLTCSLKLLQKLCVGKRY